MVKKKEPKARRQRRTVDQQIADLVAKIGDLKEREAQKQAKADPALRFASAALRSIDKALAAAEDARTKRALTATRSILAGCLNGGAARRRGVENDALPEALLSYVRSNPGQRGEQIASALATDTGTIRPVMKRLIAGGKIKTQGQKRGMTYDAV